MTREMGEPHYGAEELEKFLLTALGVATAVHVVAIVPSRAEESRCLP